MCGVGQGHAVYAITAAGNRALADGVARGIRQSPLGPSEAFITAVAYLGVLEPDQAATLLEERSTRTRAALSSLEEALDAYPTPELHMLEAHYYAAALRHDANWLDATSNRIRRGDLTWPGE